MPATAAKVTSITRKPFSPNPGTYVAPAIDGVIDYYIDVPVGDLFGRFRRNKHQRDEETRNLKHLDILKPEHRTIQVLMGYNGELVLIDAHSRWFKWLENVAIRPERIHVHVFEIVDKDVSFDEQELRLYESADSRRSVKTAAHTVQGAMNSVGLELETKWLRSGGFSEAMKVATRFSTLGSCYSKNEMAGMISHFRKELEILDDLSLTKGRFVVPFLASALIMLEADSSSATIEMLKHYNSRRETFSVNGKHNPYAHLDRLRDAGIDGRGIMGLSKGKFPTDTANVDNAIRMIIPMMVAAKEEPMRLTKSIPAWTRSQVKNLTVI